MEAMKVSARSHQGDLHMHAAADDLPAAGAKADSGAALQLRVYETRYSGLT
jgi:hypothetical protein